MDPAPSTYALLLQGSGNRVYGSALPSIAAAELGFLNEHALGGVGQRITPIRLGGVDYLELDCGDRAMDDHQRAVCANLSGLHALFAMEGRLLAPVELEPLRRTDDDVVSIQRYVGKTNEQFTRLLVNVTVAGCEEGWTRLLRGDRPLRLLDPLAGRGTTLNRAIVYGMDAVGIELDQKDHDAYVQFITTWLQDKRLKFDVERGTMRRPDGRTARRVAIRYGPAAHAKDHTIEVVNDDATLKPERIRARSIDLIVTDLPYGVQHGSRAAPGHLARSPRALLEAALPTWTTLLRPGGAIGLAWNLHTLPRSDLIALLDEAGLRPLTPDDDRFAHRVDRAIHRDLVVARKA